MVNTASSFVFSKDSMQSFYWVMLYHSNSTQSINELIEVHKGHNLPKLSSKFAEHLS